MTAPSETYSAFLIKKLAGFFLLIVGLLLTVTGLSLSYNGLTVIGALLLGTGLVLLVLKIIRRNRP